MNEQRLRAHAARKGLTVSHLSWEPVHGPYEMEGYCGGWNLCFGETADMAGGHSTAEALRSIDEVAMHLTTPPVARRITLEGVSDA